MTIEVASLSLKNSDHQKSMTFKFFLTPHYNHFNLQSSQLFLPWIVSVQCALYRSVLWAHHITNNMLQIIAVDNTVSHKKKSEIQLHQHISDGTFFSTDLLFSFVLFIKLLSVYIETSNSSSERIRSKFLSCLYCRESIYNGIQFL